MKYSTLLSILILLTPVLVCQAQSNRNAERKKSFVEHSEQVNKVVYFSVGGPALTVLSLHYEQKLKNKFWGRVGFSYAPFLLEGFTVPIGLSYLKGENAHYLELGVGTTFIYTKEGWHFSFFDDDSIEDHFLIALNSSIGYRYQPVNKKLFFKINFTPSFLPMNSEVIPILGIGVGTSL